MASAYPRLREAGVEVMVMAPDRPERLSRYWKEHELPFRAASDPGGKTLASLGQQVRWSRMGRMPALLAIGPDGAVVEAHYGDSARDAGDVQAFMAKLLDPSGS